MLVLPFYIVFVVVYVSDINWDSCCCRMTRLCRCCRWFLVFVWPVSWISLFSFWFSGSFSVLWWYSFHHISPFLCFLLRSYWDPLFFVFFLFSGRCLCATICSIRYSSYISSISCFGRTWPSSVSFACTCCTNAISCTKADGSGWLLMAASAVAAPCVCIQNWMNALSKSDISSLCDLQIKSYMQCWSQHLSKNSCKTHFCLCLTSTENLVGVHIIFCMLLFCETGHLSLSWRESVIKQRAFSVLSITSTQILCT